MILPMITCRTHLGDVGELERAHVLGTFRQILNKETESFIVTAAVYVVCDVNAS